MDRRLVDGGWFTTRELAALLGVDASSLRRWRTANPPYGPAYVRVSARVVKYSAEDIEVWLQGKRFDPSSAEAA
ncbi:helix-turn-helix transcriptional regulator [Nocardia harenae]|uniref:helix-turn-helix transcriptional regulator n=1 Tax=Nocardia harenae TaxID=358707 RepID=UPI000832A4FA|nr:helix-turn-helix domain-containing protein [Nocardia harenae]